MIWFTSDTHFGHARIIELSNRPFAHIDAMNEFIIRTWNSMVAWDDTVFHLGDVALGPISESLAIIRRLNGRKILVSGNHDRPFMAKTAEKKDEWTGRYIAAGFEEVHSNLSEVDLDGLPLVNLSHFPYNGDSHGDDRFTHARLEDSGIPLIHGHTHLDKKVSKSDKGTLQIHVGMDAWNFAPVSALDVAALIQ